MLLKQFARKDTAYNYADSIKNLHTDLYVSYSVYHYQVIASNRIRKPQNIVYYFYQGSLQLDNSLNFPATIYADKAKFRYTPKQEVIFMHVEERFSVITSFVGSTYEWFLIKFEVVSPGLSIKGLTTKNELGNWDVLLYDDVTMTTPIAQGSNQFLSRGTNYHMLDSDIALPPAFYYVAFVRTDSTTGIFQANAGVYNGLTFRIIDVNWGSGSYPTSWQLNYKFSLGLIQATSTQFLIYTA
jgi:hypothetical protein